MMLKLLDSDRVDPSDPRCTYRLVDEVLSVAFSLDDAGNASATLTYGDGDGEIVSPLRGPVLCLNVAGEVVDAYHPSVPSNPESFSLDTAPAGEA